MEQTLHAELSPEGQLRRQSQLAMVLLCKAPLALENLRHPIPVHRRPAVPMVNASAKNSPHKFSTCPHETHPLREPTMGAQQLSHSIIAAKTAASQTLTAVWDSPGTPEPPLSSSVPVWPGPVEAQNPGHLRKLSAALHIC